MTYTRKQILSAPADKREAMLNSNAFQIEKEVRELRVDIAKQLRSIPGTPEYNQRADDFARFVKEMRDLANAINTIGKTLLK